MGVPIVDDGIFVVVHDLVVCYDIVVAISHRLTNVVAATAQHDA